MTALFLKGFAIGFAIAAPVGAIGLLCIRRTLARGRAHGLASGLGAATADAAYGAVAAFGLTAVSHFLASAQVPLRLAGGAFLLVLGARTFLARPPAKSVTPREGGLLGAYASTFVLTLTNPSTVLSFAAVFAGLGLAVSGGGQGAAVLVAGVFCGSASWWLLLSGGVAVLRGRFDARAMTIVNRSAGVAIAAFGVVALMSVLPLGR